MVDDLWLPYFCVTTDISISRKAVHRADRMCDDYTWRYVRASMSLSGMVPPMCDRLGHMHVDGGYLSTVPVEVLQEEYGLSLGKIIVVDVSAVYNDPGRYKIGDAVSGMLPAIKRILGLESNIPSLEEIQTRIAFVSSDSASKALLNSPSVLVIKPPVGHIGILDFLRYQEVMRVGYEEAMRRVEEWCASGQFPSKPQKWRHRRRSL
jgi:lysophospholipid hydrolase